MTVQRPRSLRLKREHPPRRRVFGGVIILSFRNGLGVGSGGDINVLTLFLAMITLHFFRNTSPIYAFRFYFPIGHPIGHSFWTFHSDILSDILSDNMSEWNRIIPTLKIYQVDADGDQVEGTAFLDGLDLPHEELPRVRNQPPRSNPCSVILLILNELSFLLTK